MYMYDGQILTKSITTKSNGKEYALVFEFGGKKFEALIVEAADQTYISECHWLHGRGLIEIDILEFFGVGFSSDIHAMLYHAIEDQDQDLEDERE
jgi:hypothetical protein